MYPLYITEQQRRTLQESDNSRTPTGTCKLRVRRGRRSVPPLVLTQLVPRRQWFRRHFRLRLFSSSDIHPRP